MEGTLMATIPQVSPPYGPKVAEVMDKVDLGALSSVNLMRTLAHQPRLFGNLMALGGSLMYRTALEARLREIAILRTAARTRSEYEWGMHVTLFREPCRLTEVELTSLQYGSAADGCWGENERLVVRVADELHDTSTLSEATGATLAGAYEPAVIIELLVTIGNYRMLAQVLNACRVPLEAGAARFQV
jgi:4-carboxymuconolactone decarboxylase